MRPAGGGGAPPVSGHGHGHGHEPVDVRLLAHEQFSTPRGPEPLLGGLDCVWCSVDTY
jgi:hypothetical protein